MYLRDDVVDAEVYECGLGMDGWEMLGEREGSIIGSGRSRLTDRRVDVVIHTCEFSDLQRHFSQGQ